MKPCSLFQVHCLFLVIATCVGTVAVFGQARDTASLSGTVADSQAANEMNYDAAGSLTALGFDVWREGTGLVVLGRLP